MGVPKSQLQRPDGVNLLQHQLERWQPEVDEVLLLCGEAGQTTIPSGLAPLHPDPARWSGEGPLAGLLSGLRGCRCDWLLLHPIDCPFFPPEAVHRALRSIPMPQRAIGFTDQSQRPQWLPGLYHRSLVGRLEEALSSGERRLGRWFLSLQPQLHPLNAPASELDRWFLNLNTPETVRQAGYLWPDRSTPAV